VEPYEYSTLYEFESFYWWYRGLHGVIVDAVRALNLPAGAHILDMGCGTGQNAVNLTQEISQHVYGFDFSPYAAPFWQMRGLSRICLASINETPYPDSRFDAVVSIDVIESDGVDEKAAVREMWRVVKPGGYILLVVPAYKWLLTEEHHKAVHASRRYSRTSVIELLQRNPVKVIRSTHVFASLFPPIVAYRLFLQKFKRVPDQPRSELKPLPVPVNNLLAGIMGVERRVLKQINLPFGSSILTIAQKVSTNG
jgi:ubiquinone/menaquinone biosynthesis C-methylase UbiE